MTRKVTFTRKATAALKRARVWLLQKGSGPDARVRWNALLAVNKLLQTNPYAGAKIAEAPVLRQLVVSQHRIVYRVDPDTGNSATAGDVRILAVFGPGQP